MSVLGDEVAVGNDLGEVGQSPILQEHLELWTDKVASNH